RACSGWSLDQVVAALGIPGQLAAAPGDCGEATGAARLDACRFTQPDERMAVAIWLLHAEPRVLGTTGGEDRGGDIHRPVDLGGPRRDRRPRGGCGGVDPPIESAEGRDQVAPRPRETAISPVRTISIRPNGRTIRSNASILSSEPVTSTVTERLSTST